jgi:16S rRNA (cytidine1402-2'-O)-methyltransferase
MPKLYLIPVPIAENALHTIPSYAADIARGLEFFIVERAKTARHYIKALVPLKPLPELTFVEISPDGKPGEAEQTFLNAVRAGKNVGLLSEAGCPGVADPGAGIVALAHREGVRVVPLVGPSSLLLALMASGMNGQCFAFHGYLSPKRPELAADLRRLEQSVDRQNQTQLFIETPYRSQMVLEVALATLRPDTFFGVAQDISGAGEMIRALRVREWPKGTELAKAPAVFMVGKAG